MKKQLQNFTNLYEISKTLRFELKPIGNTSKMLEENKVFEKDELVNENYKEAKKYFDKLHREFINDSLKKLELSEDQFKEYERLYFNFKKDKSRKNRESLENQAKKLRKEIVANFEKTGEDWRDFYADQVKDPKYREKVKKIKKMNLFFSVEVFDFLRKKFPEAVIDEKSIFDTFNKFSTYFTGFHETRKNFYKDDGTSTAIPTRIINENLPKFLDNRKVFEDKYQGKEDELFTEEEKQAFNLNYFNHCYTQEQIEAYNDIIAQMNSKINKKRQIAENKNDFPFFKTLFKQILAEENKKETEQSDFIEIKSDEEVFDVMNDFINENEQQIPKAKKLFFNFIEDQQKGLSDFDTGGVYVAGRFINQISNKYFSDWNTIRGLFIQKGKKKVPEFISITELRNSLQSLEIDKKDIFREKYKDIYQKQDDNYLTFLEIWKKEFELALEKYEKSLSEIVKVMSKYEKYKSGENNQEIRDAIRNYAENALAVYQMMKYFSLEKGKDRKWNPNGLSEDPAFYNKFNDYYQNFQTWKYYNEFRNYLTKKPYSQEKVKLNFEDGTLLDGWDKNKESSNLGVILKKGGKYYLGIMQKYANDLFHEKNKDLFKKASGEDCYKKMVYKLMADPKRDFPKGVFSKKGIQVYKPSQEILDIYNSGSFKADSPEFSLEKLHKIIDFFKKCIPSHPSWSLFNFNHVKPTEEYQRNIGEFYNDLSKNTWRIWFEDVSSDYIEEKNRDGQLYLFEIHNKDFNSKAEGKKNLHTLYWEEIFSERNRENPIIKLNGQAEVFLRRASLDPEEDKERNAPHKIVKKKRYTEDKMFFHCPLTLNFSRNEIKKDKEKHKGTADAFSVKTREYLSNNPEVNIIGIDRGEKHLAYYSVVNQKGEILEVNSLNKINGINYYQKLDELEKKRDEARKTWQDIAIIKDMKKGYISHVVKKLCDLMIKYNAIIVFENLNTGFKRGRFAIEKQVYQNLELALAKKLNYLVFKEIEANEAGSFRHAFQLTPFISNFKDIYNQCGFMFYIPASYTSAICPNCGFRKNIPTPVDSKIKNKKLLENFNISFEKEKGRFRFTYRKADFFSSKNKLNSELDKDLNDSFVFYSDVSRLQFKRNKDNRGGETNWRSPNEELLQLFKNNGLSIEEDINKQIKESNLESDFYKKLIHIIRLILQLRNSIVKKDEKGEEIEEESKDFIQCPACHFHSEENLLSLNKSYKGEGRLEFNGDANGAYNIARKGLMLLEKISQFSQEKRDLSLMSSRDLTVTQEEWDEFVAECNKDNCLET